MCKLELDPQSTPPTPCPLGFCHVFIWACALGVVVRCWPLEGSPVDIGVSTWYVYVCSPCQPRFSVGGLFAIRPGFVRLTEASIAVLVPLSFLLQGCPGVVSLLFWSSVVKGELWFSQGLLWMLDPAIVTFCVWLPPAPALARFDPSLSRLLVCSPLGVMVVLCVDSDIGPAHCSLKSQAVLYCHFVLLGNILWNAASVECLWSVFCWGCLFPLHSLGYFH